MPEPSRTGPSVGEDSYLSTASSYTDHENLPKLPETSEVSPPGRTMNASLNRSAEAVGRGMGNAVAGVRGLPQQFERLRSKIHVVRRSDGDVPELKGSAADVVGDWRDAAESGVSELKHTAQRYRSQIAERASQRLGDLRVRGLRNYFALRRAAQHRVEKLGRLQREEPLQMIAVYAAAAFVAGIALRVWRSNSE